jgi:hypothetical protein
MSMDPDSYIYIYIYSYTLMGVKWVTSCPVNIFWMAKLIILNTTHRDLGLGDTTLLLNVFFMFFNCWLYFYFYQLSFFFVFLFFGSRWTETYISNIFLWFLYTTYTNKFEDQKSIWAHNLPFIFEKFSFYPYI